MSLVATARSSTPAAAITPDRRPTKRFRVSRRLEAKREQHEEKKKSGEKKEEDGSEDVIYVDDDTPEYDGNDTNGYFQVNEILDRRTRKYGSESAGLRHVVEYCKCVNTIAVCCCLLLLLDFIAIIDDIATGRFTLQ